MLPLLCKQFTRRMGQASRPAQSCRLGPALAAQQEPPAQSALPSTSYSLTALAYFYSLEHAVYPSISCFQTSHLPWDTQLRLACVQKGSE